MKTLMKSLLLVPLAAVALAAYDRAGDAVSAASAEPGVRSLGDQRPGAKSGQRPAAPPVRVPDGVKAHRDLAYVPNGHERQKLDLFLPEKADAPLPLIIWVHGGGWQSGSKEQCLPLRSGYTDRGYAVASIGYRLSGDAIFPAQIEDCKAAIRWLRAHAKEYNLDADHFGVWGSSAGGHLVAMLGTSGGAKEFDRGEHLDVPSRVQAVCDYYGPTDLLQMDAHALPGSQLKHDLPTSPESRLIGGAIQANRQQAAKANPITYVTKDAPPFLIVHGDQDPLVPHHQSQLLFEALKQADVQVRFHTVKGGGHGSGFGGPELNGIVEAFFASHLQGKPRAAGQPAAIVSESAALAPGEAQPGQRPAQPNVAPGRPRPQGGDRTGPQSAPDSTAPAGRPRGAEPSWLMPPVEGPNLFYKTFDSKTAGQPVSYLIYLPPDYETTKDRRYPVVYWLHGIGGSQQGVPTMAARLTKAIEEGKSPPMIVVYVNGAVRSGYVDSADGKWPVETVTIKELIPHIDATYRTIATREGRCVEGFSMGGGGAAKWGFKYPELFGTVSILAGAMFDAAGLKARGGEDRIRETYGSAERFNQSSPWLLVEKNREAIRGRTAIRVVVGENDGLKANNQRFHELLDKLDLKHEFHIIPGAPHSPNPLYDGLGEKNWSFFREAFAKAAAGTARAGAAGTPRAIKRAPREPGAGLLYYAKADYAFAENQNVIGNPHICGAFFQIIWSEVEKQSGKCDWSQLDQWIEPWLKANKKVAIRMMWVTSGNWPRPYYKTPTPQWVWREGAKFAFHAPSGTEIPLVWDPIYQKYALRFLEQFASRYDDNPNLLFVDVTPGAETNPYRFARINITHPEFKDEFEKVPASDGRAYNEELWLDTIKQWVDASDRIFKKTPLLVTLNVGGLRAADRSVTIGDYCVDRGFYVGQNGLAGRSYLDSSGGRTAAFHRWSPQTKLFFEMVAGTGGRTGTLMEVVQAAERIHCSYLNVYPEDVLRGTRGQPTFDPEYERALEYGARVLDGRPTMTPLSRSGRGTQRVPGGEGAAAAPEETERARPSGKLVVKDFRLDGERWTCEVDGRPLSGILLKPEGKGPFPAVLISHGLGGSAESFGLSKAREMVKWGLVCIAPNYTHNVRGGLRPPGKPAEPGQRAGEAGKGAPAGPPARGFRSSNFGASEENLRRAMACVEILRGLPEVDARRLAAYGHSMGGFVTVGLAAAEPDLLMAAAISGSGVAPQEGFPAPPVKAAEKIRTPLLMLHGGSDPVVRPGQSNSLKEVLDRNQVPNERYVYEGEGHPIDQTNRDDVFQRMRAWFSRHGVLKEQLP